MSNTQNLKFTTVINGIKKTATTNFGLVYTVEKIEAFGGWSTTVETPGSHGGLIPAKFDHLADGVTYTQAIKVANDHHAKGI